jgi:hypothetical protein
MMSVKTTGGKIRNNTHFVVIAKAMSIPARMQAMYEPFLNTRMDTPRSPNVNAGTSPRPPKAQINTGLKDMQENANIGKVDLYVQVRNINSPKSKR